MDASAAHRLQRGRDAPSSDRGLRVLQTQVRQQSTSAADEDCEAAEPQQVRCSETELTVTLKDGRKITTPLRWYPRLDHSA
jgi:Protein of unknown function (DUF2442)